MLVSEPKNILKKISHLVLMLTERRVHQNMQIYSIIENFI